MTTYQMIVLYVLNEHSRCDLLTLEQCTQLPTSDLICTLQLLLDSKLVVQVEAISGSHGNNTSNTSTISSGSYGDCSTSTTNGCSHGDNTSNTSTTYYALNTGYFNKRAKFKLVATTQGISTGYHACVV